MNRPQSCNEGEHCVSYHRCKKDGTIATDGRFEIDEQFNGNELTQGIEICSPLQKCCKQKNFVKKVPVEACGNSSEVYRMPSGCGFRNKNGLGGLAVGLQNKTLYAHYAEFPWMVALFLERGDASISFIGGGSLIHPRVVLTAAHKISGKNPNKLIARAGEWEMQSTKEICQHEDRRVVKTIKHPSYKYNKDPGNLALLMLDKEFPMTPFINTICLPTKGANFDEDKCITSGWGQVKFGEGKHFQNFPKKTFLPVVPKNSCDTKVRPFMEEGFKLEDGVMCAGKYFQTV